jgi:pimeloyl-ACP methyl ester carboxylesterase
MTLYVEESGTAGAPSIVFLHGIGASGWMWWKQTAALADYHCLNVDLPGHGKSHAEKWVSLADTAEQVAGIIRERGRNGKAHVVGLSMGGYVTLVLMERHAGLVERAIVSGVTAEPMPNGRWLQAQVWMIGAMRKSRRILETQARTLQVPPEKQAEFMENLRVMPMETYRTIMEEAVEYRASGGLAQVKTPTLVVAGSRETEIIVNAVGVIARMMPNGAGRLAPGVRHGWNVEAPELFNAMIRAWIEGEALPAALTAV